MSIVARSGCFPVRSSKPETWLVEALERRLAEKRDADIIPLNRGLILHVVRALREAAGLDTEIGVKIEFELTEEQVSCLKAWAAEQDEKRLAMQRARLRQDIFTKALTEDNVAYYGPIGGELTFCYTPNSLAYSLVVRHVDGEELDLTDYDSW